MFKSRRDVDKHVEDILKKIKSENERYLRGYSIAKLYFAVKEYDCAQRYLSGFLNVRHQHAGGHKLMGQIFENTKQFDKSLESYKRSLGLDNNQSDLILKVCELYCRVPVDVERARYWADRAEAVFPHHPTVFQLREVIMKADGKPNFEELEKLIASELVAKPKDLTLRIKLLKLFMDTDRVELAYDHAVKVERFQLFPKSFDWYSCLEDIFEAYMESNKDSLGTEFFFSLLSSLDCLVHLTLMNRNVSDAADILLKFDRYLEKARLEVNACDNVWQEFYQFMQGQIYFYMGTFILKRAKMDQGKWKESSKMAAALYFTSLHFKSSLTTELPKAGNKSCLAMLARCRAKASHRISQAGHVLQCMNSDSKEWPQEIKQQCSSVQSRERIYQRVVGKSENRSKNSYFINSPNFSDVEYSLMSSNELKAYDEDCVRQDPENLQQVVWLCLQRCRDESEFDHESIKLASSAFKDIQLSCSQEAFVTAGALETFCRLDAEAFLLATVMATKWEKQYRKSVLMLTDKASYMPLIVSDPMCSNNQKQWWSYIHRLCCEESSVNSGELRRIVQHGIEVIRAIGNHGLGTRLLTCFAKYFSAQASSTDDDARTNSYHQRSKYYWNKAIELLERLSCNLNIVYPKHKLFTTSIPEPSSAEVKSLLDTGRIYLAYDAFSNGDCDLALKMFQQVNTAEAAFAQAKVFKVLADQEEEKSRNQSTDTSTLSSRTALLIRARDNCYLALNRVRQDKKHPLLHELSLEVKSIESKLRGRTSDDESTSESDLEQNVLEVSGVVNTHSTPKTNSARIKNKTSFRSPHRLELQMRNLAVGQEELLQSVLDRNRALVEANRAIVEELKINKSIISQLHEEMAEMQKDLTNLKINQEAAVSNSDYRLNSQSINNDFTEDSYAPNGLSFSHGTPQNFPLRHPLAYPDPIYRFNYDHRLHPQAHVSSYFPSPLGYPSPMLRMAPPHHSMGGIPPPTDHMFNPSYLSPGANFPAHFPNQAGENARNFPLSQISNSQPSAVPIVTHPAVAASNQHVPVPPQPATTSSPLLQQLSKPVLIKNTPPIPGAHPFQIAMPPTAVTLKKSPFGHEPLSQPTTPKTPNDSTANRSLSFSSDKDYNPASPDFKPIIPLPDKVPLITGEENETVLFENKAKLYRFDDKQWKDRGVGIVKILVHKEHKKARLVMRRDEILRICANHQLVSGMNLIPKADSKLMWMWSAQDFSEEEIRVEKFCIRFSEAEVAARFKDEFEFCVNSYGNVKDSACKTPETMSPKQHGFGNQFKPETGSWNCSHCLIVNGPSSTKCIACQNPAPHFQAEKFTGDKKVAAARELAAKLKIKPIEKSEAVSTQNSDEKKPVEAINATKAFGGFSFMKTPDVTAVKTNIAEKEAEPKEKPAPSPFANFSFQSKVATSPSSGSSPMKPDLKSIEQSEFDVSGLKICSPTVASNQAANQGKNIGETCESKLCTFFVKLFTQDPATQKPKLKGVGEIHILKHSMTKKCRILMLQEQDAKVCANHTIEKSMKLLPSQNNDSCAWAWEACDSSEARTVNMKFVARFNSKAEAADFKNIFDNCARESAQPDDSTSFGDKFKLSGGQWECQTCCVFNKDESIACLACSSPKPGLSNDESLKDVDQNVNKFGGFTFNFPRGNGNTIPKNEATVDSTPNSKASFSSSDAGYAKPNFTFGSSSAQSSIIAKPVFTVGSKPAADDVKQTFGFGSKPSNGGTDAKPFSFGSKPANSDTSGFKFGFDPAGEESNVTRPTFTFGNFASNIKDPAQRFVFGGQSDQAPEPTVCVAEKSQSTEENDFTSECSKTSKLKFSGAKPSSPSPKNYGRTPRTSESHEEVEPSDADDIYFQPVGPLPPKIEVKTGEEHEEVLYAGRAKLLRMENREWKERGIGVMKILWNTQTKKIRLVMRRDVVLNLCCNHYLTEDMKFIEMDIRSFIWYAIDHSENESSKQRFALRFKNQDKAHKFLLAIGNAKKKLTGDTVNTKARTAPEISENSEDSDDSLKSPQSSSASNSPDKSVSTALNSFSFKLAESKFESVKNPNQTIGSTPFGIAPPNLTSQAAVFSADSSATKSNPNALNSFSFKLYGSKPADVTNAQTVVPTVFGDKFSFGSGAPSADNTPSAGFKFGQSTFGRQHAQNRPEQDHEVEVVYERKASPEDTALAQKYLLPDNFYLYKDMDPCRGCRGCTDEDSDERSPPRPELPLTPPETLSFSCVSEPFTFSGFASKNPIGFGFNSKDFNFAGAGTKLFASQDADSNRDDNENGEKNHDPHFEPVVPLPDIIQVKTGEEEEEVLFSERAKLYRFDRRTKEWKERGVGKIKILQHKIHQNKFRIIQRREQVYKVSCNHLITSETNMEAHPISFNAVSWVGMELADDGEFVQFSAKFKTRGIANEFIHIVNDCKLKLKGSEGTELRENAERSKDGADYKDFMFCRPATLSICQNAAFEVVGKGSLIMSHNQEANGIQIQITDQSTDKRVCYLMVSAPMEMERSGNSVLWSAILSNNMDGPENSRVQRFQANFHNLEEVDMYMDALAQAKYYVIKSQMEMTDPVSDADESNGRENIFYEDDIEFAIIDYDDEIYQTMGKGILEMFYDDDSYGTRIRATLNQNREIICDHIITIQTNLKINKENRQAFWDASYFNEHELDRFSFQTTFPSLDMTLKFERSFNKGKEDAAKSESADFGSTE